MKLTPVIAKGVSGQLDIFVDDKLVASQGGGARESCRSRPTTLRSACTALKKQLETACGTCTEHGCLDCTCSDD